MTQTAARRMASEDLGDPEPLGLASTWSDEPPARRAFRAADEGPVMFQATPVRVDDAFPAYEGYHATPELPAFGTVAPVPFTGQPSGWGETPGVAVPPVPRTEDYGWVTGQLDPQHQPPVAPGLAPYAMAPAPQVPAATDDYAAGGSLPPAYVLGATPNPYQHMNLNPVHEAPADMYASAMPHSPYAIDASDSRSDVGLIAVGGTFMVGKKLAAIAPFVGVSVFFTIIAANFGMGAWIMAAFSWLITAIAVVARPVGRTTMRQILGRK